MQVVATDDGQRFPQQGLQAQLAQRALVVGQHKMAQVLAKREAVHIPSGHT